MGQLPQERLKPAPAWHCTAVDVFGPFKIRDEVKKRTTGKAYGVIFHCLGTIAVHVKLAPDYGTKKVLMLLQRFVSLRGYPANLLSDNGTQLKAANEELQKVFKAWDWDELNAFGATKGMQREFISADAPWQNGISEALVKLMKKGMSVAIGETTLTFCKHCERETYRKASHNARGWLLLLPERSAAGAGNTQGAKWLFQTHK